MVWLAEAYAELSSVSQQIISNPFDCSNGCDLTILYTIIIGSIITIILISVQIQMAREQYAIRNSLVQAKCSFYYQ